MATELPRVRTGDDIIKCMKGILEDHLRQYRPNSRTAAPIHIELSDGRREEVALAVMFAENTNYCYQDRWKKADILIHVISSAQSDPLHSYSFIKREVYDETGIEEFWVIDPSYFSAVVFSKSNYLYTNQAYYKPTTLISPTLNNFHIPLARIFDPDYP